MSASQIQATIMLVVPNAMGNVLQNFKLANSLTTNVNTNNLIADLLTTPSNTQNLLASNQNIINTLVSRGLSTVTTVPAVSNNPGNPGNSGNSQNQNGAKNSVIFNFFLPYSSDAYNNQNMILFTVDLSFFYTATDANGNYVPTPNNILYNQTPGSIVTNATYITKLNTLCTSIQSLLNFINNINATGNF